MSTTTAPRTLQVGRIGDVVKVKAPRGTLEFKILEIL